MAAKLEKGKHGENMKREVPIQKVIHDCSIAGFCEV